MPEAEGAREEREAGQGDVLSMSVGDVDEKNGPVDEKNGPVDEKKGPMSRAEDDGPK